MNTQDAGTDTKKLTTGTIRWRKRSLTLLSASILGLAASALVNAQENSGQTAGLPGLSGVQLALPAILPAGSGQGIGLPGIDLQLLDEGNSRVPPQQARVLREYAVPSIQPESIVFDPRTQYFYGGSTTPDGTVYRARLNGQVEVFMPPVLDGTGRLDLRTQTQGFNVDRTGRLYIVGAASAKLHVYQLPAGRKIVTFRTPLDSYINDVTIARNGDIYFTDSLLPFVYRATQRQVAAGGGIPQKIQVDPPADYLNKLTDLNPLEGNGIHATPDGRFIIFGSLNHHRLYRLTPPKVDPAVDPLITPNESDIREISVPGFLGDIDGLEFLNVDTLYVLDNDRELINKAWSSNNYLQGRIVKQTTSREFRTPTGMSLAPNNRLLVTNAELFDLSEPGPPFFVVSIPRP